MSTGMATRHIWQARLSRGGGFTLIEVLLGVLILGLGLLGLASVFPLVVKKQRDAQDIVLGISSVKGVESVLRGHAGLNSAALPERGWARFASNLKVIAEQRSPSRRTLWSDVLLGDASKGVRLYGGVSQIGELNPEPGSIVFWSSSGVGNPTAETVILRTSDRLIPSGPSASPQFVWDIVPILAGPLPNPAPQFPAIRVAMFVRRIDPGIRVPTGRTLANIIATGEVAAISWNSGQFPTFDGNLSGGGGYAGFFAATASKAEQRYGIQDAPFTVLEFNSIDPASALASALRQVGQQIVDTDGNIYTVVALPDEVGGRYQSNRSVVIAPPLTEDARKAITTGDVEFLVSPVIPASVQVAVIRP